MACYAGPVGLGMVGGMSMIPCYGAGDLKQSCVAGQAKSVVGYSMTARTQRVLLIAPIFGMSRVFVLRALDPRPVQGG
jgi:hypothetical protein